MIFIYSQSLILFWFIVLSILQCLQNLREVRLSSYAKKKETDIKDVTLYYYNRQKFFRLVGFACASQFIFWSWMAYFNLSQVKLADLVNLKRNRSQDEILDVTSKSKGSWKIVRFMEVSYNYPHSYSLVEMVWMLVEIIICVEGGNFQREVSHMLA